MYIQDPGRLPKKPFALWADTAGKHKLTLYEILEGAPSASVNLTGLGKIRALTLTMSFT
jgi:hypothetical protein